MMQTAKVKLVTIVVPYEFESHLREDLRALGVSGFTIATVNGSGAHGPRRWSILDGANARFDVLASAAIAEQVLARVTKTLDGSPFVAYMRDVEAIPHEHFA
ncbi:MAG: P-II family nitrogen regulator [Polyangiaceae bacterium]|jgi:nitrogen regulatory protein PII